MNGTPRSRARGLFSRLSADYGMLSVLFVLCAYFSFVTLDEQHPNGAAGAEALAEAVLVPERLKALEAAGRLPRVLVAGRDAPEDAAFAARIRERFTQAGWEVVETVLGQPPDARRALERAERSGAGLALIAANQAAASWAVFERVGEQFPSLAGVEVVTPRSYTWPNFLKGENVLNVANQIVVIAILAVGMTLVVITAGIDLSVGSLIALSAVVTTLLIRDAGGAESATTLAMLLASLGGIGACALMGALSGLMVTVFAVPPFVGTLGMMLVSSGAAYILAGGQSVYQVPESFVWLGRGADLAGLPNAVLLMVLLYAAAHLVMSRTTLGRRIYAVGGNREAARLSGVRVRRVLLAVYTLSGALAGVGGVVMASQLRSGAPTYGQVYELYVVAAVVVGGTSLAGGEGKVFGTLIGAFIIAVIQNGMNLTGIESYTQKVVLGLVLLGAVLLDKLKRRGAGHAAA